jgi:hypothetical protein
VWAIELRVASIVQNGWLTFASPQSMTRQPASLTQTLLEWKSSWFNVAGIPDSASSAHHERNAGSTASSRAVSSGESPPWS